MLTSERAEAFDRPNQNDRSISAMVSESEEVVLSLDGANDGSHIFNRQEVSRWFAQITKRTSGDYLSDIETTGEAELSDEVVALLALYATTRKRTGAGEVIDVLHDALTDGNAAAADKHGTSAGIVGTRRSQVAARIALELDALHGYEPKPTPVKNTLPRPTKTSSRSAAERRQSNSTPADSYVGDDHLKMYLNEIGRVPLLTAEQEVDLSKAIEAGLMAEQLLNNLEQREIMPIDATQEELEWLASDGQRAFDQFVSANTRLAVNMARQYSPSSTQSMGLEDRIQVANEAIITAVKKFDYTKGFKFSTYATWWLRQGIQRALANEANTIRIPVHMQEKVNKVRRFQRKWLSEQSVEPTPEEIAKEFNLKLTEVKDIIEVMRRQPVSTNLKVDDDGETELGDFLGANRQDESFDAVAVKGLLLNAIREQIELSGLSQREIEVVERRFGIATGKQETLDDIAKDFDLTRERIRQIEMKAKNKLRESKELRQLFDALRESA